MLIRLFILIVLFIVIYRAIKSLLRGPSQPHKRSADPSSINADDVMIQDPQCGVYFARRDAVTLNENGKTQYFCSEACKEKYLAERRR